MTPRKVRVSILPSPVPAKSVAKLHRSNLPSLLEDSSTEQVTKKLDFDETVVPGASSNRRVSMLDACSSEALDADPELLVNRMMQVSD